MHGGLDVELTIDQISKIEGHAELDITVRNGKVEDVKLKINENKRFYTQAIRGKNFIAIPQLVSRICGTCSIAHLNCSTEAIEKALGIEPSPQDMILRKLSMFGLMIRDHAMHLYLFCLPDILGIDSILNISEKDKPLLEQAFKVKAVGNSLSKLILGRAVHGMFAQIGYYSKIPQPNEVKAVVAELKSIRNDVLQLIEIFSKCDFSFKRQTNFVALITPDFNFLEGEVQSTEGICIPENLYGHYLERHIIPYSQATAYTIKQKDYMVGALARLNMNKQALHPETKKSTQKHLSRFPSTNIYDNNLAQAIEILHCVDSAIGLLEKTEFKPEQKPNIVPKDAEGIAAIEAPRGILYYKIQLNKEGKIVFGDIVTPSQQNQINMENDIKQLVPQMLGQPKEKIVFEIEKLIRAYDPCFSCASHFLKVNWL